MGVLLRLSLFDKPPSCGLEEVGSARMFEKVTSNS